MSSMDELQAALDAILAQAQPVATPPPPRPARQERRLVRFRPHPRPRPFYLMPQPALGVVEPSPGLGAFGWIGVIALVMTLTAVGTVLVFSRVSPAERAARERRERARREAGRLRREAQRIVREAREPRFVPVRTRYVRRPSREIEYLPPERRYEETEVSGYDGDSDLDCWCC